jgi:hypothetical protein
MKHDQSPHSGMPHLHRWALMGENALAWVALAAISGCAGIIAIALWTAAL